MLIRAQEMARYVEDGILDAGLTGRDWIEENEAERTSPSPTSSTPSRASAKCAGCWPCRSHRDFQTREGSGRQDHRHRTGGTPPSATSQRNGVTAKVEFSWGATEVKPPVLADAIVEVTETGSSLRANKLKIIDTVLESNTQLIANHAAWDDAAKRRKLEDIKMLLEGAINALGKVGLMLNVHKNDLAAGAGRAARAEAPDHLASERRRVAGGEHDSRRIHGARHHPAPEAGRRAGNCRVSAEQDRIVIRIISQQGCRPAPGSAGQRA